MKIRKPGEQQNELNVVQQRQQKSQAQNHANAHAVKVYGGDDSVQLGVGKEVSAIATGNVDKVARIKELVQAGNYKIDSKVLARSLSDHLDEEIGFQSLFSKED